MNNVNIIPFEILLINDLFESKIIDPDIYNKSLLAFQLSLDYSDMEEELCL